MWLIIFNRDGLGDNKPWVNGRDSAAADFHAGMFESKALCFNHI